MLSYSGPSPLCAAGRGAPGAADDAAAAGGAALHVVALERLAGDGRGALELALAVVARRQGAGLVEHVDEHGRAELGQRRGGDRVGLEQLLGLVDDELEALGVGDRRLVVAVAGDDERLELLGAHDGAQAAAADGAAAVVDDGREQHAALAGRADDGGLATWGAARAARSSEAGTSRPQRPAAGRSVAPPGRQGSARPAGEPRRRRPAHGDVAGLVAARRSTIR